MLPTVRRSLWALPLSLTRAKRERGGERGRGSNCVDVRKREGEGERARQRKQTGQRLQCVSGQRGVSECSPPLFSRAKTPGGLSAPGAVIYHQSGEAGPPLCPTQLTHKDSHMHANRCARRTRIQMCKDNANTNPHIRTRKDKNVKYELSHTNLHMVNSSIKKPTDVQG